MQAAIILKRSFRDLFSLSLSLPLPAAGLKPSTLGRQGECSTSVKPSLDKCSQQTYVNCYWPLICLRL
jgi:hypothetical protein